MKNYIDIVFDGPPSHESGRFVEVENAVGASIKFGEWVKRPDDFWVIRFPDPAAMKTQRDELAAALKSIEKWVGEFPPSGRTWDDGTEMSYGAAFGANGEQDYMREVARAALDKMKEPPK
jgi:hypothetical protein